MRRSLVLGVCLLSMTWGFSLFLYDRWQRVSGFASSSICNGVRTRLAADFPMAEILCCDPDT